LNTTKVRSMTKTVDSEPSESAVSEQPPRVSRRGLAYDLTAVAAVLLLVGAAVAVGAYLNRPNSGVVIFAATAPLFGDWLPHIGPGTPFAIVIALLVVWWGPTLAARISWPRLVTLGYFSTVAWTFALAMIDGWSRGLANRLTIEQEYLHEVPGITDIPLMLRTFSSRILDFQPNSWTTHVSGHPPGATLVFVWLDRIGLSGGGCAAVVCVLAGSLVAVSVPMTLWALDRADAARAVLPFLVLFPGAIWIGASADGLFAGVTSTGIALLALAARAFRSRRGYAPILAIFSGLLLGFGIFLSYGLVLLGILALAVGWLGRSIKTLIYAISAALLVVALFAWSGFWWLDGYHLVVERYYQGVAVVRPYSYWVWADLASLAIAVGPAVAVGLRRTAADAFLSKPWRGNPFGRVARHDPILLLVLSALIIIMMADVSGLSKAETERIWLPFGVWLLCATALLPQPSRRWWLAAQAVVALVVNHLLLTFW
jgi:hypothetical protein